MMLLVAQHKRETPNIKEQRSEFIVSEGGTWPLFLWGVLGTVCPPGCSCGEFWVLQDLLAVPLGDSGYCRSSLLFLWDSRYCWVLLAVPV